MSGAPGAHPSLPARPPASSAAGSSAAPGASAQPRAGFSRTFAGAGSNTAKPATTQTTYSNYHNNSKYPQQTPAQGATYGPQAPASYGPQAPASYGPQAPASYGPQAPASYGPQAPAPYGPQAPASTPSYGQAASAPHIRNPFPPNQQQGGRGGGYRQNNSSWQSGGQQGAQSGYGSSQYGQYYGQQQQQPQYPGYGPAQYEDPAATAAAVAAAAAGAAEAANTDASGEKKKTVYRSGGGKQWADDTLLEWDPSHLRLFIGNLAGEVTDEMLGKAFGKYKSLQKALVVRDKWTKKARGYGFVSFSDPDDFFQAAKEMNNKYIGSRPVSVEKGKTEIKVSSFKDDSRRKNKKNNNNKNKNKGNASGSGMGTAPRRNEAPLKAVPSGVTKPGKTKNGLKLLG